MAELPGGDVDLLSVTLEKAARIEQALGHLAKAIELGLVDVALDPSIASNGSRERYIELGQKLAEISGLSYELVTDISEATGIPIQVDGETDAAQAELGSPTPALPTPSLREAGEPVAAVVTPPAPLPTPPPTPRSASASPTPTGEGSHESLTAEELHQRLVDPSRLPKMREVPEGQEISITILGDNKIRVRDRELRERDLTLSTKEIFILNALLLLRDKPRGAAELRALGFQVEGKANPVVTFSRLMKPLMDRINRAASKEVIKKIGEKRNTQYAVNPNAVLTDARQEPVADGVTGEDAHDVKKND